MFRTLSAQQLNEIESLGFKLASSPLQAKRGVLKFDSIDIYRTNITGNTFNKSYIIYPNGYVRSNSIGMFTSTPYVIKCFNEDETDLFNKQIQVMIKSMKRYNKSKK